MLALVVFDLAGTTVKDNHDVSRALQTVLLKRKIDITIKQADGVMGIPKPVAIQQLLANKLQDVNAIDPRFISEIHEEFIAEMIRFYKTNPFVEEIEGTSEVFRRLKEHGIKVIVDTGFDRSITEAILERLGWRERNLIDGSVTSDEVKQGRPHPDMIFKAMEIARIKRTSQVAKVGDTVADLQEGFNAGCRFVIGITSGAQEKKELESHYHTHLVHNIEQVPPILIRESSTILQ